MSEPKIYNWPSTTDKPFEPVFDDEARKRAAQTAAATMGNARSGLSALTNYIGARTAVGIPFKQYPADLSGLGREKGQIRPEDLAGLLKGLLGRGTKNKGAVLGDTEHGDEGLPEALADSKVIAALKEVGVTHVGLEITPEFIKAFRDDPSKYLDTKSYFFGSPILNYFELRNRAWARIISQCDAAGIAIVPMDCEGPMAQQVTQLANKGYGQPDQLSVHAKAISALSPGVRTERHRITGQVWVPRMVEAMKDNPNAKFVAFGGDGHVSNPLDISIPDILHSDLNENLAAAFKAPVPYVRMIQKDTYHAHIYLPKGNEKKGYDGKGTDIPDIFIDVPSRQRQELARMETFKNQPEAAAKALEQYDESMHAFVIGHMRLLAMLDRKPAKEDLAAVDALLEARKLVLEGKKVEALQTLKTARALIETLKVAGKNHKYETYIIKECEGGDTSDSPGGIKALESMSASIEALQTLYSGELSKDKEKSEPVEKENPSYNTQIMPQIPHNRSKNQPGLTRFPTP